VSHEREAISACACARIAAAFLCCRANDTAYARRTR
jgi:hypothetical protein